MNKDAIIIGWFKGEKVTPIKTHSFLNMFDGKRLDELALFGIRLQSKNDFEEFIDFLKIHQHCFSSQTTTNHEIIK